jgi:hypothetical protein
METGASQQHSPVKGPEFPFCCAGLHARKYARSWPGRRISPNPGISGFSTFFAHISANARVDRLILSAALLSLAHAGGTIEESRK